MRKKKKEFNLDLKIYRNNNFDVVVPFVKRNDVLVNGFKYCDTAT